jgi:hypothetical protein
LTGSQVAETMAESASGPDAAASASLEGPAVLMLPGQGGDPNALRILGEALPADAMPAREVVEIKPGRLAAGALTMLGAAACLAAALGWLGFQRHPMGQRVWGALALLLVLLAVNRVFDGLGAVTALLREESLQNGWYAARRPLQAAVLAFLMLLLAVAGWMAQKRWKAGAAYALPGAGRASVGGGLLLAMSLMRGVSLHQVDTLLSRHLGPLTGSALVDVLALALLAAGLWRYFQASSTRPGR